MKKLALLLLFALATPALAAEVTIAGPSGYVLGCATEKAVSSLYEAMVRKDNFTVGALIMSGTCYKIENGTRGLVLGGFITWRALRITSGAHIGKTTWVAAEHTR